MTQQDFNAAASREGEAIRHSDILAWARNTHIDQRPPDERIGDQDDPYMLRWFVQRKYRRRLVIYCGVFGASTGGSSRTLTFIDSFAATTDLLPEKRSDQN